MLLSFGQMIKVTREDLGLSRSELAKRIKRSGSFVKDMETGSFTAPRKVVIQRLSEALGLNFKLLWEIAWRERQLNYLLKEGLNPWEMVTFKETLSPDQKEWIRRNPDILKRSPYSELVLWNGIDAAKKLLFLGLDAKVNPASDMLLLTFPEGGFQG